MKIGFVFDDSLDKEDGVQQYIFSLAAWYIQRGHKVHYLVGETVRTDLANVHSLSRNVKVKFNGNRLSIPIGGSKGRIRELLSKENFDVLHVQVPYHPLLAGRIIKAAGEDTIIFGTFHIAPYSPLVTLASRLLGLWSRPSLKHFDKMVSVSPAAARLAKQTFGVTTDVVPNVFDYKRFSSGEALTQYDDEVKTVLFLGRLVPRKGCGLLLEAVSLIAGDGTLPALRVVICGGGPLDAKLKAYVKQHGLEDKVEFVGRISEQDKPHYYASADISVFPSSGGESFGIVLIEAMASGKAAVLGGNNPGYKSVLGGRPDQLFNPKSAAELAEKLRELLSDDRIRQAAAEWGAQDSRQYDVTIVGDKLLTMYQEVGQKQRQQQ